MVEFDPYDWKVHEDPYPFYRALRDEAPCYHNEERNFWALSRYDDVLAGFRDWEGLSNTQGVSLEREQVREARLVMSFLGMDPPRHDHLRNLVSRGFTPRRVRDLEPSVRELARHYVDAFIEKGECDFIDEFAGKLPMDVISEMLGVPPEDRDELRAWADLVVHREEGVAEVPPEGMAAAANLIKYFSEHVARRRAQRTDDLASALIDAELDGERLEDIDIIGFLFLMIIAGNETTTKLLGNALYWAWRNPDQKAKLVANPALAEGWVEETLRYDPSSQLIARTSTRPLEFHGRTIPEDSRVALLIGSANRDERYWSEPDRFDVERNTTGSLAFGQGTHFCLGASLARLEGRVSLEEVLRRVPDWEVREEGTLRVHSSNVRGFAHLPIEFGR
ncbi:MAG: cytochrome P450 [Myxococcota bacterium]|nr:cytochrome P450 [Myxococcota bacterium]